MIDRYHEQTLKVKSYFYFQYLKDQYWSNLNLGLDSWIDNACITHFIPPFLD